MMFKLILSDLDRLKMITNSSYYKLFIKSQLYALILIRLATSHFFGSRYIIILSKILLKFFFQIEVNKFCIIGEGLSLPHPRNIIIGSSQIGYDCTIMHGVTLGSDKVDFGVDNDTRPKIGNNCFIGINSVILGGGYLQHASLIKPNTFIHLRN